MDSGGRFFRDANHAVELALVPARIGGQALTDRCKKAHCFFAIRVIKQTQVVGCARAQMQEHRGVATIVENHVRGAVRVGISDRPVEDVMGVFPIIIQRFTLDRKDRRATGGQCGGRVILR